MWTQMNYCISSNFTQPPFLLLQHGQQWQWQVPSLSLAASGSVNSLVLRRCKVFTLRYGDRQSSVHMPGSGPQPVQEQQGHSTLSRTRGNASSILSSYTPRWHVPKHCSPEHARAHVKQPELTWSASLGFYCFVLFSF